MRQTSAVVTQRLEPQCGLSVMPSPIQTTSYLELHPEADRRLRKRLIPRVVTFAGETTITDIPPR